MNKTKAITQYLDEAPDATPREVVAALKENGIEVSAAYVSNVKNKQKKKPVEPVRVQPHTGPTGSDDLVRMLISKRDEYLEAVESINKALEVLGRVESSS